VQRFSRRRFLKKTRQDVDPGVSTSSVDGEDRDAAVAAGVLLPGRKGVVIRCGVLGHRAGGSRRGRHGGVSGGV
jgi:hypothetical protein